MKLPLKPSTMFLGKIWLFLALTALLALPSSSKQVSGVGSQGGWPSFTGNSLSEGQGSDQKVLYHSVGTPVYQAEPDETNNKNELNGNWNNQNENDQYSKTPSTSSTSHSHNLTQDRNEEVNKKTLKLSFSKLLFEHVYNLPIRDEVVRTAFMRGMASGTLRSSSYIDYMVQDIVYLANAGKAYNDAAQTMQEEGLHDYALFYRKQAQKFEVNHKELLKSWRLENSDCVKTGTAVQMYMGYHQALVKTNPRFLAIAMLPCSMLYPWVIQQVISNVDKTNPYYEDWFVKNMREPDNPSSTEIFVDTNFGTIEKKDEEKSVDIFCEGMMNELNFFREAGGERLLTFDEVCRNRD